MYERLVANSARGVSVRNLGGDRNGEMRIGRFLHNPAVRSEEMIAHAQARLCRAVAGLHVLAIQDTSSVRVDEDGVGLSLHPVLAVDADSGSVLGLVDNFFLSREGGENARRKQRPFADKDSYRWLRGAQSAERLHHSGAACVTVVEDREGDIYESFARKPPNIHKLVRAAQDRRLADDSSIFDKADEWPEMGRIKVDIAAAPGRSAREAEIALSFGLIHIVRPRVKHVQELPDQIPVHLVIARERNAPPAQQPASWFLLTTHPVESLSEARRMVELYRMRWTIEQLFRTMKTKGFDIEALRQDEGGPLEKLVTAVLIAAITVMQVVAERECKTGRPLTDAFDPEDSQLLQRACRSLEGRTQKQKNPYAPGTLAYAGWVLARLGGWTGYYGKPGPIVMFRGLVQFETYKRAWAIRDV